MANSPPPTAARPHAGVERRRVRASTPDSRPSYTSCRACCRARRKIACRSRRFLTIFEPCVGRKVGRRRHRARSGGQQSLDNASGAIFAAGSLQLLGNSTNRGETRIWPKPRASFHADAIPLWMFAFANLTPGIPSTLALGRAITTMQQVTRVTVRRVGFTPQTHSQGSTIRAKQGNTIVAMASQHTSIQLGIPRTHPRSWWANTS